MLPIAVTTTWNSIYLSYLKAQIIRVSDKRSWWHRQMETFPPSLASQRPVVRSFSGFFDLRPNKRLNHRDTGDLRRHRAYPDITLMQMSDDKHIYLQKRCWSCLRVNITLLSHMKRNCNVILMNEKHIIGCYGIIEQCFAMEYIGLAWSLVSGCFSGDHVFK